MGSSGKAVCVDDRSSVPSIFNHVQCMGGRELKKMVFKAGAWILGVPESTTSEILKHNKPYRDDFPRKSSTKNVSPER